MIVLALACVLWAFAGATPVPAVEVREAHYVMGTLLEITVEAPDRATGQRWIRRGVAEARGLDRELTSFDEQSALSRLNRAAGEGPQGVPPDLYRILERAGALSRASGGAFDVTVGPLVALWKEAGRTGRWPDPGEIDASRSLVGYEKIRLRPPDHVELDEGVLLELGGIGKGYAVDRIVGVLRSEGVERGLVSFGESSIRAMGAPAGEDGWPVWVRRGGGVDGPIRLRDRALSTSRSRGRVWTVAGRRVGHILDPRSGLALGDERQATVLATRATDAEAWSKALLVDPRRAFASCEEDRERACVVLDARRVRATRDFAEASGWSPSP